MIEFLLLDLDDTILDFHKAERIAIAKTFSDFGVEPTEAVLHRYHLINKSCWERLETGEWTREQVLVNRFDMLFAEVGVEADATACARAYEKNLSIGHYFLPGAQEAVETLSKKYRLFLVSNGTASVQKGRMTSANLYPYFEKVFVSQELGHNKPSIAYFEKAFAQKFVEVDKLTEFVRGIGAKGLAWARIAEDGTIASSFAKFMTEDEMTAIKEKCGAENGDVILIVGDTKNSIVLSVLGALRCEVAKRLNMIDKTKFNFLWVTEFPLFEYSEEDDRFYAKHHPFTMPMEEDLPLLDTDPGAVRARAYDCVLNGTELGGGSIRIHTTEMQTKMFEKLGIGAEEADEKFGFLLEAFKYGVPPHGGLAFGLDRVVTLLLGLEDIRDVIAFPKVQNASELLSKCPAAADPAALNELGIAVVATEEE